mmetsp:Transcript_99357/g.228157  ORF Transcript_99357/g.228157 Transcript_99357/m.228157 type:complete len:290 (-) Transcript_99357:808-1677(-)
MVCTHLLRLCCDRLSSLATAAESAALVCRSPSAVNRTFFSNSPTNPPLRVCPWGCRHAPMLPHCWCCLSKKPSSASCTISTTTPPLSGRWSKCHSPLFCTSTIAGSSFRCSSGEQKAAPCSSLSGSTSAARLRMKFDNLDLFLGSCKPGKGDAHARQESGIAARRSGDNTSGCGLNPAWSRQHAATSPSKSMSFQVNNVQLFGILNLSALTCAACAILRNNGSNGALAKPLEEIMTSPLRGPGAWQASDPTSSTNRDSFSTTSTPVAARWSRTRGRDCKASGRDFGSWW